MMKKIKTKTAFTLIEIVVALLLLFIVLLAAISFQTFSYGFQTYVSHKRVVREHVMRLMENEKRKEYNDLVSTAPEVILIPAGVGELELTITKTITEIDEDDPPNGTDYKQLQIVAEWVETGQQSLRKIEMLTLIAP